VLKLHPTAQYKKDRKRAIKRGLPMHKLDDVLRMLIAEQPLGEQYRDHALTGDYVGFRECHVQPNWLLIYAVDGERLILTASRTGSHGDLF
jgi:mRNA interferase YafQ